MNLWRPACLMNGMLRKPYPAWSRGKAKKLTIFLPKYLPSGLIVGMLNVKLDVKSVGRGLNIDTANYFGATTATLLLLAYAAVFAFLGIFTSLRRDVN